MTQTALPEALPGLDIKPGTTWAIDPAHSTVEFVVRHLMSRLRGRFHRFSATVALGATTDPQGKLKVGFGATAEIDRFDFGLSWNATVEKGALLVARTVKIEVNAQFAQQA